MTGDDLLEVVKRKAATAGSLDGWGWRDFKSLPVPWFDRLARILSKVEELGGWPDGLLDAYIAMIPETDGDATLGQRPLSVLPFVYRMWPSARMVQLEDWFKSCVPDAVFSDGGGRGSADAWYSTALDIEEVLSGAADSDVHLFVAYVVKSFYTVCRKVWMGFGVVLACRVGSVMLISSIMLMLGCASSLLQALGSLGRGMGAFLRVAPLV